MIHLSMQLDTGNETLTINLTDDEHKRPTVPSGRIRVRLLRPDQRVAKAQKQRPYQLLDDDEPNPSLLATFADAVEEAINRAYATLTSHLLAPPPTHRGPNDA